MGDLICLDQTANDLAEYPSFPVFYSKVWGLQGECALSNMLVNEIMSVSSIPSLPKSIGKGLLSSYE
jgi:hypothetical protein